MNIYILAFLLLFQFPIPQSFPLPDSQQKQKSDKAVDANMVFRSTDGVQSWQDVGEGLSGKLEEGGFSLSWKIRIWQVFYRQEPRTDTKYFCCTNFKSIKKEMP